jgi:RNA polymerase sigma factor (sigma-70 family)
VGEGLRSPTSALDLSRRSHPARRHTRRMRRGVAGATFSVTVVARPPSNSSEMTRALADVDIALVALAADGDARAVTDIVRTLERPVYGIALRMLFDRRDAEDATQEALIRIVTRLAQFRGEAKFSTWAYRIAVRRILDFRDQRAAAARVTSEAFAADLADGLDLDAVERAEDAVLHHQLKLVCGRAMLHCLDSDHRIAFVLGEIVQLSSAEASLVLEIEPATFRKRLSRARATLTEFLNRHCGVVNPGNSCRCHRRLDKAIALGRVERTDRDTPRGDLPALRTHLATIDEMKRVTTFYRDEPELVSKRDFVARVRALIRHQEIP